MVSEQGVVLRSLSTEGYYTPVGISRDVLDSQKLESAFEDHQGIAANSSPVRNVNLLAVCAPLSVGLSDVEDAFNRIVVDSSTLRTLTKRRDDQIANIAEIETKLQALDEAQHKLGFISNSGDTAVERFLSAAQMIARHAAFAEWTAFLHAVGKIPADCYDVWLHEPRDPSRLADITGAKNDFPIAKAALENFIQQAREFRIQCQSDREERSKLITQHKNARTELERLNQQLSNIGR